MAKTQALICVGTDRNLNPILVVPRIRPIYRRGKPPRFKLQTGRHYVPISVTGHAAFNVNFLDYMSKWKTFPKNFNPNAPNWKW